MIFINGYIFVSIHKNISASVHTELYYKLIKQFSSAQNRRTFRACAVSLFCLGSAKTLLKVSAMLNAHHYLTKAFSRNLHTHKIIFFSVSTWSKGLILVSNKGWDLGDYCGCGKNKIKSIMGKSNKCSRVVRRRINTIIIISVI